MTNKNGFLKKKFILIEFYLLVFIDFIAKNINNFFLNTFL